MRRARKIAIIFIFLLGGLYVFPICHGITVPLNWCHLSAIIGSIIRIPFYIALKYTDVTCKFRPLKAVPPGLTQTLIKNCGRHHRRRRHLAERGMQHGYPVCLPAHPETSAHQFLHRVHSVSLHKIARLSVRTQYSGFNTDTWYGERRRSRYEQQPSCPRGWTRGTGSWLV